LTALVGADIAAFLLVPGDLILIEGRTVCGCEVAYRHAEVVAMVTGTGLAGDLVALDWAGAVDSPGRPASVITGRSLYELLSVVTLLRRAETAVAR
jgi:hypothetical protein